MQSLDNLRKVLPWCCEYADTDECRKYASCQEHIADMLDAIEQELAERYIELPVDADRMPIHVGDVMEFARFEIEHPVQCEVFGVGQGVFFAWCKESGYTQKDAVAYRHAKPDTWERVISDAIELGYIDPDNEHLTDRIVARCRALAGEDE